MPTILFVWKENKTNSVRIDEMCQIEIKETTVKLRRIFDKTKLVKDTQKLRMSS